MTALGDKAVQLAQGLIRCESVTPDDAGAIDVLIEALKPARFTFWRLTFKDDGHAAGRQSLRPHRRGSAASLLRRAYRRGAAGRRGSCGPIRPSPPRSPTGCLYGRGAADMKGAIACFAAAALDYVKSQRARARRLDHAADHRRRGRTGHQRHAQGAGLDEGPRRAARPLPRRRADQCQAHRRGDQDRPARQPERPARR